MKYGNLLFKMEESSPLPDIKTAEGFQRLYDLYWKKVYTICEAGTHNSEEAKDLTQSIFLSLWQKRNHLTIEGPVENYLFKAAKYQVINYCRNRKIKQYHHSQLPDTEQSNGLHYAENTIFMRQLEKEVHKQLVLVSSQCREVFLLQAEQGLSLKEIAGTKNLSVKTVQYHLSNAKKYLRKKLSAFL